MHFYEVLVSSGRFHGSEPLTYNSGEKLGIGAIVVVPLRAQQIVGVVVREVTKPTFTTKPIVKVVTPTRVPHQLLDLLEWMRGYYPAPLGTYAQLLLPASLLRQRELPAVEPIKAVGDVTSLPKLIEQQQQALGQINRSKSNTVILHGDTGTGKTRLYLELAKETLAAGKSVLVLTPEIGLTPQLEQRLKSSLPAPVVTMHSHLTPAERRNVWLQILQATEPIVVLGPRSALFTPIQNLGLLVMDEAHDQAYKQEKSPYYQTMRVASQLAKLHDARFIIGTATPPITDYYIAEQTKTPIIRLTDKPAGTETDKHITIVNLRDRAQFPGPAHLSQPLLEHIKAALKRGEQSLVFLNRRGTARLVLCQECGWQALCPNCDLPLTYHGDAHNLRCHTCGHTAHIPTSCPVCKATEIIFKSIGTKSIFDELQKAFPEARIKRFDTDNIKEERLEQHFDSVAAGDVDILVGTQILAKGLDLPKLSVVGVIAADTSLYFPDYTAEEQTFQLLTQVIGRVGRGHSNGFVVVQTYDPESIVMKAVANHDWQTFYQRQLDERRAFGFPPFYYLLKLSCARAARGGAQKAAEQLREQLLSAGLHIEVVGPTPGFHEKAGGKYHWQLLVKAKKRGELLKATELLPSGWSHDIDPANLL